MTFWEQCCHSLVLELAELGIEAFVQTAGSDPYVSFEPYSSIVEFRSNAICFWVNGDGGWLDPNIDAGYIEFEYADPNSITDLVEAIRKVYEISPGSTGTD